MNNRGLRILVFVFLLMCLVSRRPEAQTPSAVAGVGEWLITELGSYALGKVLDRVVESSKLSSLFDRKRVLEQVGANGEDSRLTQAELRSVNTEITILYDLMNNKVPVNEVAELQAKILSDNRKLLAAIANHEIRIQNLEFINSITGSWVSTKHHFWLKILPAGTICCCLVRAASSTYTSIGEIKYDGKIEWQSQDCTGDSREAAFGWTVSLAGPNLILVKGGHSAQCARATPAMPDSCSCPF